MFDIIDAEKCFSKDITPFTFRKGEYDLCEPYFRAKKELPATAPALKKRKKNTATPSVTDVETEKRHEQLRSHLTACLEQLDTCWLTHWANTKEVATTASAIETETIDFPSIQSMVETAHGKFDTPTEKGEEETVTEFELSDPVTKELDIFSVFNTMIINKENETKLLEMTPTCQYLIPPKSKFLMGSLASSIRQLGTYVQKMGGADLIVMDPPWSNKSVSRSSHYDTQDIYDLYSIPMLDITSTKDCIVAVWVTNKPKFRNFIINKLFPSWQLECVAEWTWLKVTTQKECIFPLDSTHKKPYEQLIIGRPIQRAKESIPIPNVHSIISIPSLRHSRKPPLEDVLCQYLEKKDHLVRVELFARCLLPGWISWGNECLKFQHLNYFDKEVEQDLPQNKGI